MRMLIQRLNAIGLAAVLVVGACSGSTDPPTTVTSSPAMSTSTPTTSRVPTTTSTPPTRAAEPTSPFNVGVGDDGVTYDLDGAPPSGPSSFTVLDDGSVVIADTIAVARGEPRLLHYDRSGEPFSVIALADEDVAAIVDVVTDGSSLAILDVLVSMNRYRVIRLGLDGEILMILEVPRGFWFEDGLTGLAWDDSGILLEFEFGARYARLDEAGSAQSPVVPVFDGSSIELRPGSGRTTVVTTGDTSFSVERATDLGGAALVGISPDGSIVIVVDEVDLSGPVIEVTQRVRRYSPSGRLTGERVIDPGEQYVEIQRPFELDASGQVLYLRARSDALAITAVDV